MGTEISKFVTNPDAVYLVDGATGHVLWLEGGDLVSAPMWADPSDHDGEIAEWDNPGEIGWGMIDPEVQERDEIILKMLLKLDAQRPNLDKIGNRD